MHERDIRVEKGGSSEHDQDEEEEQQPDFRQRVAQLGYYLILKEAGQALQEALKEFGVDLEELVAHAVKFERDGDTFTLELARELFINGVRFGKVIEGRLTEGALEELDGVTKDGEDLATWPPPPKG